MSTSRFSSRFLIPRSDTHAHDSKGIGFSTVRHLLRAKAGKVYLAARDGARAKEAIKLLNDEGLGKEGSGSEVLWHELDLSDPDKAKLSAEAFIKREHRLDILSEWYPL